MKINTRLAFVVRVAIKALALFLVINVAYVALNPLPALSQVSIHNTLVPGRLRLQYVSGDDAGYGRSTTNMDLMMAGHEIAGAPKQDDEYRVLLMGDSSAWGYLLDDTETLSENLNRQGLVMPDGRQVRAFNLALPGMYATKDLLVMERVNAYQPDLVVWLVNVENFRKAVQGENFFACDNMPALRPILNQYDIADLGCPFEPSSSLFRRTLVGQRREIAEIMHSQLDGLLWAATGVDHNVLKPHHLPRQMNSDTSWMGNPGPVMKSDWLVLNAMNAARGLVDAPILVVNEPILALNGINDRLKYNRYFPRWAFDQGSAMIEDRAGELGMSYLNLWNAVAADQFTDNEVHYTARAARHVADLIGQAILKTDDLDASHAMEDREN